MDMVGNVEQWCLNDYYAPDTVALDARPELRSYRGGSFNLGEGAFRVAERGGAVPHYQIGLVGFRLVWCLG